MADYSDKSVKTLPPAGSHIHFIGIGGSSMSGLALILLARGYVITGSDREEGYAVAGLRAKGIRVAIGQRAENILPETALVVYTVAVGSDNPELVAALSAGIPVIERGALLGLIASTHPLTVSVTGTHGKTTTTAMLSTILLTAGKDPAIHIGGNLPLIGGSVRPSGSEYFVTEACEYHAHMLQIPSFGAILLNVEAEHMDFYGSDENLDAAFRQFTANLPSAGFLVVCAENARAMKAASGASCKVATYAVGDSGVNAEFTATDIVYHPENAEYTLRRKGRVVTRVTLRTPGRHNVSNSIAAAAAAIELGISPEDIAAGLNRFEGTGRRFEKVGSVKGALLIDDYAHHPTEVEATLEAARGITPEGNRVISIFQVHTFTRAILFRDQFTEALKQSDEIIVTNIFAAREQDPGTVSGLTLTKHFKEHGLNALFISNFDDVADYVYYRVRPGDTVITLGAGDVNKVLNKLIKRAEMDE